MCAVRQIGAHNMAEKEAHIMEVSRVINITNTNVHLSRSKNQLQMTNTLKNMSDPQKWYFAKFVSITGLIGGLSPKEDQFINWLFSQVQVPELPD